jgi:hypothetical protein
MPLLPRASLDTLAFNKCALFLRRMEISKEHYDLPSGHSARAGMATGIAEFLSLKSELNLPRKYPRAGKHDIMG